MLILELRVNDEVIGRSTARRIAPKKPGKNSVCTYIIDEGTPEERIHEHVYGWGARHLAQALFGGLVVRKKP